MGSSRLRRVRGPPTHIALLRRMCVEERRWIPATEFEYAIASVNLLPGPASTQLAIYGAWRLRKTVGAIVGGVCFIIPGLVLILMLSAVFLAHNPPRWILGAAAGTGSAVPAVAISAACGFVPGSWKRIGTARSQRARWFIYGLLGTASAATIGPYLVLVLIGCGLAEVLIRREGQSSACHPRRLHTVIPARCPRSPPLRSDPIQPHDPIVPHRSWTRRHRSHRRIGHTARSRVSTPLQVPVLAAALAWFFALRRGVVSGLLTAGGIGVPV
jgi:chromate transport protein ChrA